MSAGTRYDAMLVTPYGQEGKSSWVKIGAAFVNKDGSIGVKLDAYPAAGSDIVLQIPLSKEEKEAKFGSHGQAMRQQTAPQRQAPQGRGRGYEPPVGHGYAPPAPVKPPSNEPWIMPDGTPIYDARELPKEHPDYIPF
jgi:hypothetical protein